MVEIAFFVYHVNVISFFACFPSKNTGCELTSAKTPDIVSDREWRSFWISFDQVSGHLQVGREGEPAFMAAIDNDPINVEYLGYRTSNTYTSASFRFCIPGTIRLYNYIYNNMDYLLESDT